MLDVDLLRTFVAITESGSFTAAAEIVGRTQSAVSLQVRKLEDQVGHALFLRDTRTASPRRRTGSCCWRTRGASCGRTTGR